MKRKFPTKHLCYNMMSYARTLPFQGLTGGNDSFHFGRVKTQGIIPEGVLSRMVWDSDSENPGIPTRLGDPV